MNNSVKGEFVHKCAKRCRRNVFVTVGLGGDNEVGYMKVSRIIA